MKNSKLVSHGGITVDLSQVKAFHIDSYNPDGRSHILKIEFKSRYEYLRHPGTKEYEKVLIKGNTEHPYEDFATAEAYRNEWEKIWQDYLEEEF